MINSILGNRPKPPRYAFVLPLIGGILFCGIGYFMGRIHLQLMINGARAQGTIVDFRTKTFTSVRSSGVSATTGYMPVVEYLAFGDKVVRFEDWLGS